MLVFSSSGSYYIWDSSVQFWWPFGDGDFGTDQWKGFGFLLVALTAASLLYIALDGFLWPVTWFLSSGALYPFASLSYTGYLMQLASGYIYGSIFLPDYFADWTTLGNYSYIAMFFQILLLNLFLAFIISVAIEVPFMNLYK